MTIFGVVQRVLAISLMALANSLAAASNSVASVEIHETLQGHFVYMKNCVFCHGKRGDGKGEMGLTVKPRLEDNGFLICPRAFQRHFAFQDQIKAIGWIAFAENHFTGGELLALRLPPAGSGIASQVL